MNIMFLSIENYSDFNARSIYMDLINEFRKQGHYVTVISACEQRDTKSEKPQIIASDRSGEIRKVYVANVTKMSNFILKGINLMKLLPKYRIAAKKAMKERTYSLMLYGSPPITSCKKKTECVLIFIAERYLAIRLLVWGSLIYERTQKNSV